MAYNFNSTTLTKIIAGTGILAGVDWNFLDVQQTSATVETFVFKTGGSSGTIVATIVITYTSSTKADIDTVERTV